MGVKSYDNVLITGLSSSGTTDDLGAWNEDVALSSFVTLPSGATGVILRIDQTFGGNRWVGVRTPGKTTAAYLNDISQSQGWYVVCQLGAGGTIDLYCETAANANFYIVAITDAAWSFTDIDSPVTLSTTSTMTTFTLSGAPEGTIAAAIKAEFALSWRPYGSSAGNYGGIGTCVGQVDSSKRIDLRTSTSTTVRVVAYITSGVNFPTFASVSETWTADSTWRTSTMTNAGKSLVNLKRGAIAEDGIGGSLRRTGSAFNPNLNYSTLHEWQFTSLDSSGQFDYWLETGMTDTLHYLMASFDEPASGTALSITSVSPSNIDSGETVTIVGTGFGASQGASIVKIGNDEQAIQTWGDQEIVFTASRGTQSMGNATLTVVKV